MSDNLQNQLSRTLGDAYTIDRELGGGGMSRVYVAEDTRLRRKVVIKVLSPELAAGVSAERFEREIQLAAALQQANIVPVLSAGETDGLPWYAMPFIDGLSLRARLARNGAMPVAEVVSVLRDVARALAYAHDHGIVHRDIKPENILLSGDAAVVTDFGIAKALSASRTNAPGGTLTQVGTSIGTPAYMAPEQAAGDPNIDHRADIYALGCVAYEMLSGAPPFSNRPVHQIFAAHMAEAPVPVSTKRTDVSRSLASLVMRCLEKDANKRPQSAREILQSLDTVTTHDPVAVPGRRRWMPYAVATTVVVIAGAVIAFWKLNAGDRSAAGGERTIAVLPFSNAGADSAQTYFAEGIADELTTALSKIPGLRVASRSAAFATAKHTPSAQDAGRALHVTNVLEGSVRRSGNRIRITAQLTQVADGISLWSDSFDEDAADVFKAQDELSRRIASALHEKLAVAQSGTVTTARGTQDLEAYDLYLRGRYFWQHRGEVGLRKAAFLFTNAIQRDSSFARAWAGLALAQVVLPEYESHPTDTLYTAGLKNAAHAITLDPNLGDGHLALAYGLIARWELDSSEASFRRALALSPNDPSVHQWYGDLLQSTGRMKEALDQMHMAQRLDPTSALLTNELAYIYGNMRNFDESLRWHHKGVELDSTFVLNYSNAILAYGYLHQPDSALAVLKRSEKIQGGPLPPSSRAIRAVALAVSGRTADARRETTILEDEAAHGLIAAFNAATAHAGLGDREETLKWLTKSVDAHETDPLVQAVVCFPPFDFLNGDPRYTALLARMHLKRCIRT